MWCSEPEHPIATGTNFTPKLSFVLCRQLEWTILLKNAWPTMDGHHPVSGTTRLVKQRQKQKTSLGSFLHTTPILCWSWFHALYILRFFILPSKEKKLGSLIWLLKRRFDRSLLDLTTPSRSILLVLGGHVVRTRDGIILTSRWGMLCTGHGTRRLSLNHRREPCCLKWHMMDFHTSNERRRKNL